MRSTSVMDVSKLVEVARALIETNGGPYSVAHLAQSVTKASRFLYPNGRGGGRQQSLAREATALVTLAGQYSDQIEHRAKQADADEVFEED